MPDSTMPDNFVDRVVRPRELGAIDGLSRSARRREQLAGRYPPFKQFSTHCVGVLLKCCSGCARAHWLTIGPVQVGKARKRRRPGK